MINITFTEEGNKLSLRLEGHAGYAEIGKDIICSSATILAYTVAHYVLEAEHRGDIEARNVRLESGEIIVSCEAKEDALKEIKKMYSFAMRGYQLLANTYPQYVRLMP